MEVLAAILGPSWGHVGNFLVASWQSQRKATQHDAQDGQRWPQDAQHSSQRFDFAWILGIMLAPKINKRNYVKTEVAKLPNL